jgi:Collagen triple helix repeat (20 copies)
MARLKFRRAVITGATALALVAGGTAAGAAIGSGPVDSNGVIHGCWTNAALHGSHIFVLQDAGTGCPSGTTAIEWNQAGPAGPAGSPGPAGPKGDTGPQGPPGNDGAAGPADPAGLAGAAGSNGNTVLNGTGAPADSIGDNSDFYIDTAAQVLYGPKSGGTWPAAGVSLVGPPGPQGPPGTAGGLDAINRTPCDTGTPEAGTLQVTYSPQPDGTVTTNIGCDETTPQFGVNVTITDNQSSGSLLVTSSPGTISCSRASFGTFGQCSELFAQGTTVTLTESTAGGTVTFDSWSGCTVVSHDGTQCILANVTSERNVTAVFH